MIKNQCHNDYLLDAPGVDDTFSRKMKAVLMDIRGRQIGAFLGQWYVTEVLRTKERQRFLYSKGRSYAVLRKAGFTVAEIKAYRSQNSKPTGSHVTNTLKSMHIKGVACDIVPIVNGELDWDVPDEVWAIVGRAARAHGLDWGGYWSTFVDRPHVQLTL